MKSYNIKNIKLAIEEETRYFDDVLKSKGNRPELIDYISKAGYDDISQFQEDKKKYALQKTSFMDWELTSDEITYHLADICETICKDKTSCIFYNIDMNQTSAFVPVNFNKEDVLEKLGIVPIYGKYNSNENKGIIITGNGDLKFAMSCPMENSGILYTLKDRLVEYLKRYFTNVKYTGNDILINNKKVVGFASRKIDDMMIVMFNMTFNNYLDIINQVCEYDKIPGFIENKNIDARKVLTAIKSWITVYER